MFWPCPGRRGHGQVHVSLRAATLARTPPREGRGDGRVPRRARGYQEDGQGRGAKGADGARDAPEPQRRREVRGRAGHVAGAPGAPREGPPGHRRDGRLGRLGPRGRPVRAEKAAPHGQGDLRPGRGREGLRGVVLLGEAARGEAEGGHATGPREGCLGLEWAPGTAQAGFGDSEAVMAGAPAALRLPVATLPHPDARLCVALACERAGRAPRTLVPGDATEAGGMAFGRAAEPRPLSRSRAHCRCEGRHRDPHSGNEGGPVGSAVGLLRRDLLVPVPEAASPDGLDEVLHEGCERIDGRSEGRGGSPRARRSPRAPPARLPRPARPSTPCGGRGPSRCV